MSKQRRWQAEATFPGDGQAVFGIQARSLPAALLTAYRRLSGFPLVAEHLTVTRIYWRGARRRP